MQVCEAWRRIARTEVIGAAAVEAWPVERNPVGAVAAVALVRALQHPRGRHGAGNAVRGPEVDRDLVRPIPREGVRDVEALLAGALLAGVGRARHLVEDRCVGEAVLVAARKDLVDDGEPLRRIGRCADRSHHIVRGRRRRPWRPRRWQRWRRARRREVGAVVQHVRRPADLRVAFELAVLEANPRGPHRGVHRYDVWVWERREAVVLPGPAVDLSAGVVVDGRGARVAEDGGASEGDHHLRRPDGNVVLVRGPRSAVCKPLRHLRVRAVPGVVENVRRHGAVAGDDPPLGQKVGVAVDEEALAEAVDGAPLGEHLPPVVQEGGAACRVAAVDPTRR